MKKPSPTNKEIANDWYLWMKYADPIGIDTEADFNVMSEEKKLEILVACGFTDEQEFHDNDN